MAISQYSSWRVSAVLNFTDPIMGSFKSTCETSYRLLIETLALNCLLFEKIVFLCTHFGDRQTNRRTEPMRNGKGVAVANGALIIICYTEQ